jgi:hypothetical protein
MLPIIDFRAENVAFSKLDAECQHHWGSQCTAEMSNGGNARPRCYTEGRTPVGRGSGAGEKVRGDEGCGRESVRYEKTKFCKKESDMETRGEKAETYCLKFTTCVNGRAKASPVAGKSTVECMGA